jgi:hypothetical protein
MLLSNSYLTRNVDGLKISVSIRETDVDKFRLRLKTLIKRMQKNAHKYEDQELKMIDGTIQYLKHVLSSLESQIGNITSDGILQFEYEKILDVLYCSEKDIVIHIDSTNEEEIFELVNSTHVIYKFE